MANTFKSLLGDDVVNTRTMLHEAIPITGTISSGTYKEGITETNIKTFSHGMYESVYDYAYLSSSANHIFDVSFGYSSAHSASTNSQNSKKINIYNQMAQVLMGYDVTGNIRKFDSDGTLDDDGDGIMNHCFFVNFSRLLVKDEIKKNSFRLKMFTSGITNNPATLKTLGDYNSTNQFRSSPCGDYGLVFTGSAENSDEYTGAASVGLIFYQAGILVLTASILSGTVGAPGASDLATVGATEGYATGEDALKITGGTVEHNDAFTALVPEAAGGLGVTATVMARTSMGSTPSANQIHWHLTGNDANKIANLKLAINGTSDTSKVKFGSGITDGATVGIKGLTAGAGVTSTESFATLTADNYGTAGNDITITDSVGSVLVNESALTSNKLTGGLADTNLGITRAMTGSAIETLAGGFRHLVNDIDFNNTIELNSAIYFCRINHNEYNYSSNPTYVAGSKLVVKNNVNDLPISYLTTVGLYSPDNELLAVAKLSEPIRKDPNTELTLRVRLDY